MPRIARQISKTNVYHTMIRGNDKQDIFLDEQDYYKFLKEVKNTKIKYKYQLYAYCLMPNHAHLVIHDKEEKLSKIVQSLTISYSEYFNKKYERIGHLFQNRFLSKNVENREYLLELCRYIHQNPVKAKIELIEKYQWSSYREYIYNPSLIDSEQVFKFFGRNKNEAIKGFIEFHKFNIDEANDLLEYEIRKRLTDEEVSKYIKKILKVNNFNKIRELNVEDRKIELTKLKQLKGTSSAQIARVMGINKKMIERMMK